MWNTTEGGPCLFRPIDPSCGDSPNNLQYSEDCVETIDADGICQLYDKKGCDTTICDENYIVSNPKTKNEKDAPITTPFSDDFKFKEKQKRHRCGWNNAFAFPWEIGLYYNFSVGGVNSRPIGCPGLDTPYSEWPFKYCR